MRLSRFASVALLSLSMGLVQAQIRDQGVHTLDMVTGLSWLDLTQTQGWSLTDARAAVQPGGALSGYRIASRGELEQFFRDAGFGPGLFQNSGDSFPPYTSIQTFIDFVGATRVELAGDFQRASWGYYEEVPGGQFGIGFAAAWVPEEGKYHSMADIYAVQQSPDVPSSDRGIWLILDAAPVPEPASGGMILGGLALLCWVKRRSNVSCP